jgi:hypothetical protein
MISINNLLDMIATEAIEGQGPEEHHFDESKNKPYRPLEILGVVPKLPPIIYNLELIKKADGSYEWVE